MDQRSTMNHPARIPSRTPALLLALALAAAPSAALAQSAGSWLVRLGATQIKPEVTSGDLTAPSPAGTKIDVREDTQPTAGITYLLSDRLSLDLPLAAGFEHEIVGAGAIEGAGRLGTVKALPVTLLLQWRFFPAEAPLRPYVGIGPTYAYFYDTRSTATLTAITGGTPAQPTLLEMESKLTYTVQLGLAMRLTPRWGLDVAVMKTPLKTTGTLSTGQTIETKVDPLSAHLGLVYRF
jgi:outer membrane protein